MNLLETFLQCEIQIITVYDKTKLIGYFPLAFKHNNLYGTVCNSLPFYGSNGGMIVEDDENQNTTRKLLLNEFNNLISSKKCVAYTVISNPLDASGDNWLRENIPHNLVDERVGQITHFPSNSNINIELDLLNLFEDPRPRNIRKAQKEGVKVYVSNTKEELNFLYKTHYDNITAINGIAKDKRFFDLLSEKFTDDEYKIYIAEYNGEKIAALLIFFYNKTVEYFTPAVVEKYRNLQPTVLIIYQAMLDAVVNGYKNWNWGGTWLSQGGVYDFKKKWGTKDYPYFYYTKIIDEKIYKLSKEILLNEYPYFFVLPFSALKND